MAFITVTGFILDPNGTAPTSGTLTAQLSGYMIDSDDNIIVAKQESVAVTAGTGAFSIVLESTLDCTPNTRTYEFSFTGVIEGIAVTQSFGPFALAPTPSSVTLADLIQAGIVEAVAVYPLISGANVFLTLKETDQTLPAGLWRFRITGDVLSLEKNTAAAGDFSTLTELYNFTGSLLTLNVPQRLSSVEPRLQFYESDQAADEKLWDLDVQGKTLALRTRTDADGAGVTVLSVARGTGTAVGASEFPGTLRALRLGLGVAADSVAALTTQGQIHQSNESFLSHIIFRIGGTSWGAGVGKGLDIQPTLNPAANAVSYAAQLGGTINEATSGVHSLFAAIRADIITIVGAGATVTNTATFYVEGAMSATVTGENYAGWVDAGKWRHDDIFQLNTYATLQSNASGATALTFMLHNGYWDGADYRYMNTDEASQVLFNNNGNILFRTGTSGTAGDAISFINRMTITEATGAVTPGADNAQSLGTAALRWSDVRATLINGADYGMDNGWKMTEADKYSGYPKGWATGHQGMSLDRVGPKDPGRDRPAFAVTDDFIEYQGRRITAAMIDRFIEEFGDNHYES